ncbi:MAG: nucleoside kinase [Lachnospiraceae bacterium]|nr:nucleoside kinase [Lachnospiraceae bacterium]
MDEIVCFTILGEKKEYKKGTKFVEIAKEYQKEYKDDIVLVSLNNRLSELFKPVERGGNLSFVTTGDAAGRKAYRRSVTLMMQKAVHHILGNENSRVRVCHCISQAYYCELVNYGKPGEKFVVALKEEMRRMTEKEIPIVKDTITTDDAVKLFHDLGMTDKERLFRYRRSSRVNIYSLDNYIDYFYGFMAPNTSYLKYFDIQLYGNGFVLMFPNENTKEVAEFAPSAKHFETLKESSKWSHTMGIGTVGALNDAIASGRMQEIMMVQEALMEQKIGQLANQIASTGNKKFVMIAGPSSSGKTTFSHRLSIQLSALGLKPHPLSLDNYYIDRSLCPRDAEGNFDFECLEALDVQKFNTDMCDLLAGKTVDMPTFNFKTGKREYKDRFLTLGDDDILVIEGIHGLNDRLSHTLPSESKFKIFISALTQINLDEHNYMPTTDGRLIRRIVRDARTRNTTAEETIAMWRSVRRGEEKYIFPFQESADVMFNSGLIYELAVLKSYAEPLLFHIDKDSKEYIEAKRLLKFLDYLLPMPSEDIAKNSIMREFIGGSMFNV